MLEEASVVKGTATLTFDFDNNDYASDYHISNIVARECNRFKQRSQRKMPAKDQEMLEEIAETRTGNASMTNEENEIIMAKIDKTLSLIEQAENERAKLKDELEKINLKNKYLTQEIERENQQMGFEYNIGFHNSSAVAIATTLHEELLDFQEQSALAIDQQASICTHICETLRTIVYSLSSDLDTVVYGSLATKLCMPWSDIDLIVVSQTNRDLSIDRVLSQLEVRLKEYPSMFSEVKYISGATIPVIKAVCTHKYANKRVDITIQDGKHNGIKCVELVKKYLHTYEPLKYLVVAFKQLIYNSRLNDPYQGGLTSYALILMIVAFLQFKSLNAKPTDPNPLALKSPNLGMLFIEFLNLYANLDYASLEISPFLPSAKIDRSPYSPKLEHKFDMNAIVITDPLNAMNNVARSTHKFFYLRIEHLSHIFLLGVFSNRL